MELKVRPALLEIQAMLVNRAHKALRVPLAQPVIVEHLVRRAVLESQEIKDLKDS